MQHIKNDILENDSHALGALLRIHSLQTLREQRTGTTLLQNGTGFNGLDAGPMSNIVDQFLSKGSITSKQMAFVKRVVIKYVKQLAEHGYEPYEGARVKASKTQQVEQIHTAELKDGRLLLNVGRSRNFREMVEGIKAIIGRKYDPQTRLWTIPITEYHLDSAEKLGFAIPEAARALIKTVDDIDESRLDPRMFPYQKEGVKFFIKNNGRCLLGDEQGTGKTCQIASYLRYFPELRPAVIVCPATLKNNWERELRMWISPDINVHIISGKKPYHIPAGTEFIIINYDIISVWVDEIIAFKPAFMACDEVHYCKSPKAARTKACLKLSKHCPRIIVASGTPIKSRTAEFFPILNMVATDLFPSFWAFANEFSHSKHNGFGWTFHGGKNSEKLFQILKGIMIRRLKVDVLPQLPPKMRSIVLFDMANKPEYDFAKKNFIAWVAKKEGHKKAADLKEKGASTVVAIGKLKRLAVQGVLKDAIKWIEDFLESGEKLVVFAHHHDVMDELSKAFKGISVRIDGSVANNKRQAIVDAFQNDDKVRLFIGNINAAGVGITLTAASNVAFVELPWTPGELEQAIDRVHRIGADEGLECIMAHFLVAKNSIMEDIAKLLDEKMIVLSQVLDGKMPKKESILTDLIKNIKGA